MPAQGVTVKLAVRVLEAFPMASNPCTENWKVPTTLGVTQITALIVPLVVVTGG